MSELAVRQRGDRAVFGVVFLMLFAFRTASNLFRACSLSSAAEVRPHGGSRWSSWMLRCWAWSG